MKNQWYWWGPLFWANDFVDMDVFNNGGDKWKLEKRTCNGALLFRKYGSRQKIEDERNAEIAKETSST